MSGSNYEKFQTRNPVVRRLIDRFYDRLLEAVEPLAASTILDAGCGEGETLARLGSALPSRTVAVDLSGKAVDFTAKRFPTIEVERHSIDDLPFPDHSFDLVLCLEVLEHLKSPTAALAELARVAGAHVIVSVPHEPWFRAGSLLRGNYLRELGNHPEHVNRWTPSGLSRFLEPQLKDVRLTRSFPWSIAHGRPRCWPRRLRSR
jgi:2-polyprenyl-3-methyl-5-hydroxy-6-metoxy-1,4-benzoquinol methylase